MWYVFQRCIFISRPRVTAPTKTGDLPRFDSGDAHNVPILVFKCNIYANNNNIHHIYVTLLGFYTYLSKSSYIIKIFACKHFLAQFGEFWKMSDWQNFETRALIDMYYNINTYNLLPIQYTDTDYMLSPVSEK